MKSTQIIAVVFMATLLGACSSIETFNGVRMGATKNTDTSFCAQNQLTCVLGTAALAGGAAALLMRNRRNNSSPAPAAPPTNEARVF